MNQPTIVSIGEVLWDLFPEEERFGGAPANYACHAADGGGNVIMVSAVGDDPHGRAAITMLEKYGVDSRLIEISNDDPTGTVGITLDEAGKPTFTIHEGSAWDRIHWRPEMEAAIQSASGFYFGTLAQRSETSRHTIQRCLKSAISANVPRVLDINLRTPFYDSQGIAESIELASVLKLSDDEIEVVRSAVGVPTDLSAEEACQELLKRGALDIVVMTQGADGALLVTADQTVKQPSIPTEVVDTVGAGDAFAAHFTLGLLRRENHQQVLKTACEQASAACRNRGAVPPR